MKTNARFAEILSSITFYAAFLLLIFASQTIFTNAATRTWDGGGADNNWSTAANWSADTVPTSADDVVFDGTSVKNANVDAAFTVNSTSINSGYMGTLTASAVLTVNNAFTQSAGTFQGTAADANFNSLILNAGSTFNAPSGTLTLSFINAYYVFDYNGGTFNANGGTFVVDGRPDTNYFRYQTPTFNNLIVKKPLILNSSIIVNGNLTLNAELSSSTVDVNGGVTFASGYTSGSAILNFGGILTRTVTIGGATVGNPITLDNPHLTLTTSAANGTVNWTQKVTLQRGTLNQSAANYVFSAAGNFNAPGFEVKGGTFNGSAGDAIFNTTIGISSGTFQGGAGATILKSGFLSGGSIKTGTGHFGTDSADCSTPFYVEQSGGTFTGGAGNVKFCDFRGNGGSFTAPSGNLTIGTYADLTTNLTFNANGGTLIVGNNVSISASNKVFNNVTLEGANAHSLSGTPKPTINGTFNLTEGAFTGGDVAVNGDVIYGANFTGGGGRLFFEGTATRTINLPARNILLGMTLDNPNITVTTSDAGASTFTNSVEVKRGLFRQGSGNLTLSATLTVSGGTFQGSAGAITNNGTYININVSGGTFQSGAGAISGGTINTSGGTFNGGSGDIEVARYEQSGGTFNAPTGTITVIADWTHPTSGTFNGGSGTVKFTGFTTPVNCGSNGVLINVAMTETFYNLDIANTFCSPRFIAAGDTLIVANDLRLSAASIGGGRIRPLGTTTTAASNNSYVGSTIVEYVTPNRAFVINNPSEPTRTLPIEMNAVNSTLTSSGTGRLNVYALDLINGTVNQGAGMWDITNAGLTQNFGFYRQSGGTFNGSAAELFVNPTLTGGTFNGGTGKITGTGLRQTGGTFSAAGDLDTSIFTLEGGTFNAPAGTMRFTGSNGNCYFTHTAASGNFNPRTGTVEIQQGICSFDVNARETFNNLVFRGGNIIAASDTLVVNGTTVLNGGFANGGSIEANGDVQYLNGGTGNSNGNPTFGTTVLKFVDTATRTVNLNTSNQSYATLATLVDNPNITVNFDAAANGLTIINALDVRRGTVNQGDGRTGILNYYTQSGGIYNAGTFSGVFNLPTTGFSTNFTLSGGDFNAGKFTQFFGNYTHTAGGGNFNYGTGTVNFTATGGVNAPMIDVSQTENFYNVEFNPANGSYRNEIAAGDTLIANGNLTSGGSGAVNGGTLEAKRNVAVAAGFGGGTSKLTFSGATDQIFTNNGVTTTSGMWTVNKPNSASIAENGFAAAAPTNLLISGNIGNNGNGTLVPLNIVTGNVIQTGNYSHALASLTISPAASFVNEFAGTITLGGDVVNDGVIRLNANGAGCQADSILLRSTNATQRNWNGAGYFLMTDVDVKGQAGTPIITVYSGTNSGGNGANWVFDGSCLQPTAAPVSISGRVLNSKGRGIANVSVVLTDAQGVSRVAVSNAFGNYRFNEVAAGQTVVLAPRGRKYSFVGQTQVLNLSDNLSEINFTAND